MSDKLYFAITIPLAIAVSAISGYFAAYVLYIGG